jgi:SH3 domain protein
MTRLSAWFIFGALTVPFAALAETNYVTDQLTVPLHAEPASAAPVLKTLTTGASLEVIEQGIGFVRVRDATGIEGWVEAGALSARPPSSVLAKGLRAELDRTRAQLVQAQTLLDKSRTVSGASLTDEQAQAELTVMRTQLAQVQSELKKKDEQIAQAKADAAAAPASDSAGQVPADSGFGFLWLGFAFAMLVLGFIGGIIWVRESIRRRMGGMYLRI